MKASSLYNSFKAEAQNKKEFVVCLFAVVHCLNYSHGKEKKTKGESLLIPDFEEWIPGASGHRQTVVGHAQTAHSVVVAC